MLAATAGWGFLKGQNTPNVRNIASLVADFKPTIPEGSLVSEIVVLMWAHFNTLYNNHITSANPNYRQFQHLWSLVDNLKIPVFVYFTPQNKSYLESFMSTQDFEANQQMLHSFFPANIPLRDYTKLLPDDLFYDNDHLLPEGNRRVAEAVQLDIAPMVLAGLKK